RREQRDRSIIDMWRYRVSWQPLAKPAVPALEGTWLLVAPAAMAECDLVVDTALALGEHGARVVRLLASGDDREELTAALRETLAGEHPQGVVSLLALDEREHPTAPVVPMGLAATVALLQALG